MQPLACLLSHRASWRNIMNMKRMPTGSGDAPVGCRLHQGLPSGIPSLPVSGWGTYPKVTVLLLTAPRASSSCRQRIAGCDGQRPFPRSVGVKGDGRNHGLDLRLALLRLGLELAGMGLSESLLCLAHLRRLLHPS